MISSHAGRIRIPAALTIAGSDSGGGAGIQADIKTFQRLQVFGTSAITCLTAQNPDIVRGISPVTPGMVGLQITTVCEAFRVAAAKTGMLFSASIIRVVAKTLTAVAVPALVVDPVMVATSGARLLREDAVNALCSRLLPLATVITPNVPEAETLCGFRITSVDGLKRAAREIGARFGTACVVKGGHLPGNRVFDALFDASQSSRGGSEKVYSARRVSNAGTHGTGCVFSAALTAYLARGETLAESVRRAKRFVGLVLRHGKKRV